MDKGSIQWIVLVTKEVGDHRVAYFWNYTSTS